MNRGFLVRIVLGVNLFLSLSGSMLYSLQAATLADLLPELGVFVGGLAAIDAWTVITNGALFVTALEVFKPEARPHLDLQALHDHLAVMDQRLKSLERRQQND